MSVTTGLSIIFILLFLVGIGLHALIAPDLIDYKKMKKERSDIKLTYNGKYLVFNEDDVEGVQSLEDAGFTIIKTDKDG